MEGMSMSDYILREVGKALERPTRQEVLERLRARPHEPLLDRVWELRHTLSAYDAVDVALAEVLDTRVLTCDGRLAGAPGAARRVELVRLRLDRDRSTQFRD
jgi:predicted nucleic acid-binding protein